MKEPFRNGIYEVTIEPEEARAIAESTVATNNNFRTPVSKSGYDGPTTAYADAMSSGRWNWTDAAPIRLHFNDDGVVVCSDGLHRLYASPLAGVPLRTIVMFGPEYVAGSETDRGKNRTFSELLKHNGVSQNVNIIAGAVRLIQMVAICVHRDIGMNHAQRFIHSDNLLDLWRKNAETLDGRATMASRYRKYNMPVAATTAALTVLPADVVDEIAEAFDHPDDQPVGNTWTAAIRTAQNHYARHGRTLSSPVGFDLFGRCYDAAVAGAEPKHFKLALARKPAFPSGIDHRPYLPSSMWSPTDSELVHAIGTTIDDILTKS